MGKGLVAYLAGLSGGRFILWCYFLWYLLVAARYFDPSRQLWLTAAGLSAIIGFALYLNATGSGPGRVRLEAWQMIRLFMMPFCVSSFSMLVKGKGFILVFSPDVRETAGWLAACALLGLAALAAKRVRPRAPAAA